MNIKNNRKGQMRIIEVILALFIIVFALSFASLLSITPASPKYQSTELEKLGYNVLHDLDKQGLLPEFVYKDEWNNITAALRVNLPINVFFNLTIYSISENMASQKITYEYEPLNVGTASSIFYGETEAFSENTDVASVTYCMVGTPQNITAEFYETKYDPRILVLQLTQG